MLLNSDINKLMYNEINSFSTHGFSPKQVSNDVVTGVVRLLHTFLDEVGLPYVQRLKPRDSACRQGGSTASMHCMGAPNDLKVFDFRAFVNSHKLCIPAVF